MTRQEYKDQRWRERFSKHLPPPVQCPECQSVNVEFAKMHIVPADYSRRSGVVDAWKCKNCAHMWEQKEETNGKEEG